MYQRFIDIFRDLCTFSPCQATRSHDLFLQIETIVVLCISVSCPGNILLNSRPMRYVISVRTTSGDNVETALIDEIETPCNLNTCYLIPYRSLLRFYLIFNIKLEEKLR